MLPLSTKKIRIYISPKQVVMALVKSNHLLDLKHELFDFDLANPWKNSLKLADNWIKDLAIPSQVKSTIFLSSELAPLSLIPWRNDFGDLEVQKRNAADYFSRVCSDPRIESDVVVDMFGYGKPSLASSVAPSLIEDIKDLFNSDVVSVRPLSVSLLNEVLRQKQKLDYWFVVAETKNLVIFYIENGTPSILRVLPLQMLNDFGLKELLKRELRMAGKNATASEVYSASHIEGADFLIEFGWVSNIQIKEFPLHLIGGQI